MFTRLISFFRHHWALLGQSIYTGEKHDKNLAAIGWFGIICAVFGTGMSIMNFVQHKGFVTLTTVAFALSGFYVVIAARVYRNRRASVIGSVIFSALTFSYYAISGANDGFAILWTLLMPLAISYFMGVKQGVLLSLYFEALVIILFYTPLRQNYVGVYTETFMNRFPIVYLCGLMITVVSMTQYHESMLIEMEYSQRLNEEVEKQTKLAKEQSRVATERANLLERLSEEMVETLAQTIDAKDKYTNGHSFRVSQYSVALAEKLGWSEGEIRDLKREALLHDIGKIGVPDAVLNKPGRLTQEEFKLIQSHATVGKNILERLDGMSAAAEAAAYHHERWDGGGYPEGLQGLQIPKHARVISIADAYDAMRSDRVYRKGLPMDEIRSELVRGSGTQFDPVFLTVFLELLDQEQL